MPEFSYIARTSEGDETRGTVSAQSRFAALAHLQSKDLTVTSLDDDNAPPASRRTRFHRPHLRPRVIARVSATEKAVFCRQLAISVGAGVPLRESLEAIAEDVDDKGFSELLKNLIRHLHDGKSFSQAIAVHQAVFGSLFTALIRAAEEAGSLARTLEYLADSAEAGERLRRRIAGIVAYPIFVAVFFCIVCLVMTLFVLPQFQEVFAGYNAKLPLITRVVFGVNKFIITNIWFIAAAIIGLIAAISAYSRTPNGRLRMDRFKLRFPVTGLLVRKLAIARFARNLAIMARGGVPIATAMEITSGVCGNEAIRLSLVSARESIIRGNDIAGSLEKEQVFPQLVIRMVRIGESSGQLPEVLEKISTMYESQVESSLMMITSLLEPVIICLFGMIITALVLAIYVPVFTVSTRVGGG